MSKGVSSLADILINDTAVLAKSSRKDAQSLTFALQMDKRQFGVGPDGSHGMVRLGCFVLCVYSARRCVAQLDEEMPLHTLKMLIASQCFDMLAAVADYSILMQKQCGPGMWLE